MYRNIIMLRPFKSETQLFVVHCHSCPCKMMPTWRSLNNKQRLQLLGNCWIYRIFFTAAEASGLTCGKNVHGSAPHTHARPARKSPLLKADALPAQCVFKTEPAACLQSADHRTAPASSAAWGGTLTNAFYFSPAHSSRGWCYLCVNVKSVHVWVNPPAFDGRRARSIWWTNSNWISLPPKTNPQTRCPWFKSSGFFSRYWVHQV